jgi:DNA repair exonuclease SbcCD ATPase subunit
MSDSAQPETAAFNELQVLVVRLAEELANFRRRAHAAEARLKEIEGVEASAANLDVAARCADLEKENARLTAKLETANSRARQMLERVRFLRQQAQAAAPAVSGASAGAGGDR